MAGIWCDRLGMEIRQNPIKQRDVQAVGACRDAFEFNAMDPGILPAVSGLIGSLVGGVSTFAASWLTQRGQVRTQTFVQRAMQRETLYAEFIIEASRRIADAWSHQAGSPEVIAGLYSALERMRLTSSDAVVSAAEKVLRHVMDAYAAPDKTFDELRAYIKAEEDYDPLRDFSAACRLELSALRN